MMRGFGIILMVGGLIAAAVALGLDPSVPTAARVAGMDRVNNIGLLTLKQILGMVASASFIGGTVLYGCAAVIAALAATASRIEQRLAGQPANTVRAAAAADGRRPPPMRDPLATDGARLGPLGQALQDEQAAATPAANGSAAAELGGFRVGDRVHHQHMGNGVVEHLVAEKGMVSVRFDDSGVHRFEPRFLDWVQG